MPATRTNCARRGDAVYGPDDAFDRANRANRASRIFAEGIFSRHILRSANGGKVYKSSHMLYLYLNEKPESMTPETGTCNYVP